MAHVFVEDLDSLELRDDDRHHLFRVLRVAPGETVTVSDGAGGWRECVAAEGRLEGAGDVARVARPTPPVGIGFALAKGDRPAWTVQKLTELGVDVIVPMTTERSVVRWDDEKAARGVERLQVVAREAAMQSRRAWLPSVRSVVPLAEAVDILGGASVVALAHPGGEAVSLVRPAVLVGPEGGFSDGEVRGLPGLGTVGLGPLTLRSETAAVAAAVRLGALRDG